MIGTPGSVNAFNSIDRASRMIAGHVLKEKADEIRRKRYSHNAERYGKMAQDLDTLAEEIERG